MKKLSTAIIITGLTAGTLDITAACVQFYLKTGKSQVVVFNYISSALIGREAYSGNALWSVMGLLMHYALAFGWTILFYFLYPRLRLARFDKFAMGIIYGVFVWTMMTQVLVPMTRIQQQPFNLSSAAQACAIIVICVGTPISLLASRYFKN